MSQGHILAVATASAEISCLTMAPKKSDFEAKSVRAASVDDDGITDGRSGGWGGIRTHEELTPLPVFKTGAVNHLATHPSFDFNDLTKSEVSH